MGCKDSKEERLWMDNETYSYSAKKNSGCCLFCFSKETSHLPHEKNWHVHVKLLAKKYLAEKELSEKIQKISREKHKKSYSEQTKKLIPHNSNPSFLSILSYHRNTNSYISKFSEVSVLENVSEINDSMLANRPFNNTCISQKTVESIGEDYEDFELEAAGQEKNQEISIGERKYRGELVNGVPHGTGSELWPDGSIYEGSYNEGHRHGKGKFDWPDGNSFEGVFENDEIKGYGVFKWNNGDKYEGQWKKSKMHGEGTFTWKNGNSYIGRYSAGVKHGYGIFLWNNGKISKGQWRNGQLLS